MIVSVSLFVISSYRQISRANFGGAKDRRSMARPVFSVWKGVKQISWFGELTVEINMINGQGHLLLVLEHVQAPRLWLTSPVFCWVPRAELDHPFQSTAYSAVNFGYLTIRYLIWSIWAVAALVGDSDSLPSARRGELPGLPPKLHHGV